MTWHDICQTHELAEGQSVEAIIEGNVIAIFRHEATLFAVDGMCLHQGGPLARGKVANKCVTCPWHGWQYELETGNNATTCKPMLTTYAVREVNGWVQLEK